MIPTGIILIWHGDIVNIPEGFALCDGNNGTPDLTDRFVMGAGDSYNPGNFGGVVDHTHDFIGDPHSHNITPPGFVGSGSAFNQTTATARSGGTSDAGGSLPPYYALAYIMKL